MHGLFIISKDKMKTGSRYADIPFVNVLLRKDADNIWVGTDAGLSLFNVKDTTLKPIGFPDITGFLYVLCMRRKVVCILVPGGMGCL